MIDGDDIVENHFYDIGVAVGTEKGLMVPVIRDAEQKIFAEIEHDIADYAKKAREGKITDRGPSRRCVHDSATAASTAR